MDLEEALSELKSNTPLLKGILSTSKEHPIMYLNEFAVKGNKEYETLQTLFNNGLLYENKEPRKNYVDFCLTKRGEKELRELKESIKFKFR